MVDCYYAKSTEFWKYQNNQCCFSQDYTLMSWLSLPGVVRMPVNFLADSGWTWHVLDAPAEIQCTFIHQSLVGIEFFLESLIIYSSKRFDQPFHYNNSWI